MTSIRAPQFPFNAEHLLLQGVSDYAIYMLDPEGHILSWNTGGERIKGYTDAEVIGQHFSRFYPREDIERGVPAEGLAIAAREGRYETEGWRVRKDGSRFRANIVIDAIHHEGELVGFAKITKDITDRYQAAEHLRGAERALAQAQKISAIGQLTLGIAHDFNNLLAVITASLDLLPAANESRKERLVDAARSSAGGHTVHAGEVVSGDTFVAGEIVDEVRRDFPGVLATDMESTALAHTAHLFGIPFVAVRGVSDLCGAAEFSEHVDDAADRAADVVVGLLQALD